MFEDVLDCPEVRLAPVFEEEEVRLVEVLDSPRRVVVEEPSVLTVRVVVRAEPLVLTRDVVVVIAGATRRLEELLDVLVWLVRLEEEVALALFELLEPLELLELLEVLELLELLVALVLLELLELLELVEPLTRLEPLALLELLEPLELV